jgi:inositol oxygenase
MFRDYNNAQPSVKELYRQQRLHQCECFVKKIQNKYCPNSTDCENIITMTVWDALLYLDKFVDLSDPDTSLPNSQHAIQAAEKLRKSGAPEWMQLCGLLHDLGKVLYMKGCAKDGTDAKSQFAVVGDTYPVNVPLQLDSIIFPELPNTECKCNTSSAQPSEARVLAEPNGFASLIFTFGHDEYLYQVFRHNTKRRKIKLNDVDSWDLLYVIRFHSFYPWHQHQAYSEYADETDVYALPLLQQFSRSDLYSKHNQPLDLKQYKKYYDKLMRKYLGCSVDDSLEW